MSQSVEHGFPWSIFLPPSIQKAEFILPPELNASQALAHHWSKGENLKSPLLLGLTYTWDSI